MECGSRVKEGTLDPLYAEGSDREVYPELARANLLRMQGNYEAAIDICRQIIGRFPSNETVHALLGDIYADQGKLDDAIQWYELLVELAPNNVHYSARLHNLRALQAAKNASTPVHPAADAPSPKPKKLAYALYALLALILIAASFVAGARMNAAREAAAEPVRPAQASLSPAPEPARIPPPATADAPSPPTPTSEPVVGFSGMSAVEAALAQKLSQRLNGAPVWCAYDPTAGHWQARLRIQSGVLSKPRVLQEALALARAFYELSPSVPNLLVSVIIPTASGGDVLVFSGEFTPQHAALDPAMLNDAQADALLQQLRAWWNPAINFPG